MSHASALRISTQRLSDTSSRPRAQPAARPRFACSTTSTAGKRSRTNTTVSSVESLSTTTVSTPATLSRHCSIHGIALCVVTTTVASTMLDLGPAAAAHRLPEENSGSGKREADGDEEEEEARREGGVRAHADAAEEADEEGLSHREAVERERHQEDEEEERPHHVVDARAEVDPDGSARGPDRQDAHRLDRGREEEDVQHQAAVRAEVVHALVEGAHRTLDTEPDEQRTHLREQGPRRAGEEEDDEQDRPEDEGPLEPEVGVDVVVADREHEPDRAEKHGRSTADAALDEDDRSEVPGAAGLPLRRLEDAHGVAADRRRQDLAGRVRDEVRPGQPPEAVDHPLRCKQPLPAQRHRKRGSDYDRDSEREPPEVGRFQDFPRLVQVDLEQDVGDREGRERDPEQDPKRALDVRQPRDARCPHAVNRAWTRRTASIASRMSSSLCAGERGRESTSSPARSATGSAGCSG